MPTYVYVIIALAIVLSIYFYIMYRQTQKIKADQQSDFKKRFSGNPLTTSQKGALAFGAILAIHRFEEPLEIALSGRSDGYEQGLRTQWGIENRDSAVQVLTRLMNLTASSEMDAQLSQLKQKASYNKMCNSISKEGEIQIDIVTGVQSTYAWDICRAVNVAKWNFWVGYLTEEEALRTITDAADIARQKGEGWHEYTSSFLLGRTIQGFDLDDVIVEASQLISPKGKHGLIYETLPFK